MRIGIALFVTVLATACSASQIYARQSRQLSETLVYFRDERTGLCFARSTIRSEMLTHVPCEPVAALLPAVEGDP